MTKEELIAMLTETGLGNDEIVALLNEVIADLSGAAEAPVDENPEDKNKAQVMEMLGAN